MLDWLPDWVRSAGTPVAKSLGVVGALYLAYLLFRAIPPSARLLRYTVYDTTRLRWLAVARDLAVCVFYFAGQKTWVTHERLYRAARIVVEMGLLEGAAPRQRVRTGLKIHTPVIVRAVSETTSVPPPLPIDTCFDLFEVRDRVAAYFDMLDRQGVVLPEGRGRFLSTVEVATGFLAPLHLLAGLVAEVEDDWGLILTQYGRAVSRRRDSLPFPFRTLQVFEFDCWLLWGPSIPVCTCRQWSGVKVLQYGYGDENNSIQLLVPGDDAELGRLLTGPFPDQEFAFKVSVTGRPRRGSTLNRNELCAAQQVVADRPRLLLDYVSHRLLVGGPAEHRENRYYSAYVWIMFVLVGANDEPLSPERPWQNLYPFFEHGNVGDSVHYRYFKEQVVRKALTAIRALVSEVPAGGAPYHFAYACALDDSACGSRLLAAHPEPAMRDTLTRLLQGEFADLARGRHVVVPAVPNWQFVACHLPEVVDAYYAEISGASETPAGRVSFQELTGSRQDVALLERFHAGIYQDEFPDPDERESLGNMRLAIAQNGLTDDAYHLVLALDAAGEIVGGVIADYLARPNAGVIEFLVIAPSWRRQGIGRLLLADVERRLGRNAQDVHDAGLRCLIAEIDDPPRSHGVRDMFDPRARLHVWHRWGFRRLVFDYVQPALSEAQAPVTRLLLAAKPLALELRQAFPAVYVTELLREYVRFAMRRENPETCAEYRQMATALAARSLVRTAPLARPIAAGEQADISVRDVTGPDDADAEAAVRLYAEALPEGPHRVPPDRLREMLARVGAHEGASSDVAFSFHFCTLRLGDATQVQGLVSFFTFAEAGFGGYVVLGHGLRRRGLLDAVVAQVETRMIQDGRAVRGWYVECAQPAVVAHMAEHGFYAIDVEYVPPALPGAAAPGPLTLMYKTIEEEPPELTASELLHALACIFSVVYDAESPRAHPAFTAVKAQTEAWSDGVVRWR